MPEDGGGHAHGEMRGVVTEPGPLSFAVDTQRPGTLDLDLDITVQCDGKCIESGP